MIKLFFIGGAVFIVVGIGVLIFQDGRKYERAICQAEKLEEVKIINNNNEKTINENVQVFKRKEVNRAISVSDDLKFVRENYTYN